MMEELDKLPAKYRMPLVLHYFGGLSRDERTLALSRLQGVTSIGGIHLIRTANSGNTLMTVDELRSSYQGWQISVESNGDRTGTVLARKSLELFGVSN